MDVLPVDRSQQNIDINLGYCNQDKLSCAFYKVPWNTILCSVNCKIGKNLKSHLKSMHNVRLSDLRCGKFGMFYEKLN